MALPNASKTGSSAAAAVCGPDARMRSWPFSAGSRLPDTGASPKVTTGRRIKVSPTSFSMASTPIVAIWTQRKPVSWHRGFARRA